MVDHAGSTTNACWKTLIVEDDPIQARLILELCRRTGRLHPVMVAGDAGEALDILSKEEFDLLIVDVFLPKMTGYEFIQRIVSNIPIIVVTAERYQAVEAFEHEIVDLIIKPVGMGRLLKAINRLEQYERRMEDHPIRVAPPHPGNAILLKKGVRRELVQLDKVIYLSAKRNHVVLQFDGFRKTYRHTLREMLLKLPADKFIQCHRSFIVRKDRVLNYRYDVLEMDGFEIPVGPSFRNGLVDKIGVM